MNLPWAFDETLRQLKGARKDCRMLEARRLEGLEEDDEADIAFIFLDPPFAPSARALRVYHPIFNPRERGESEA